MSEQHDLVDKTVSGALWTYMATYGSKLLVFISTMILAYLITKSDFGVVGYTIIITSLLDAVYDLGIGTALIYHREEDGLEDTAFWSMVIFSALICAVTWPLAPLAGAYFNDPRAVEVVRVSVLFFPLTALGNAHEFLIRKRMQFKKNLLPTVAGSFSKGIFSILFALLGFGYWSIILGQLVSAAVGTIAYWSIFPWRPSLRIKPSVAASLVSYGGHIVFLNLLVASLLNVDYLFIGRYLGAEALGVYTLAFRIPDMIITQFGVIINRVTFPAFVKMRDTANNLSLGFEVALRFIAAFILPVGAGIVLTSAPFWQTFFPATWAEAIPVMRAIAIYTTFTALTINAEAIYKAQGTLKTLVAMYLLRLAITIPALFWAINTYRSFEAIAWAQAGVALLMFIVNLTVAARAVQLPLRHILQILRPSVVSTLVMTLAVWAVLRLTAPVLPVFQLLLAALTGILFYLGTLRWQDHTILKEGMQTLRRIFNQNREGNLPAASHP
ncbi:MAG: lipopolysaccharide biosynthesis protein [Chloroflexi bacterium]|nr:lipopolysaccharide biosynthesis protein [Chloroflexota bacterium]